MAGNMVLRLVNGGPHGKSVYPSIGPGIDYSVASNASAIYSVASMLGRHIGKNVRKVVVEYNDNSIMVIWRASDGSITGIIAEPNTSTHRRQHAPLHQQ